MVNVHSRVFAASVDRIRPWVEACWSGTERDAFPRDVIPTWRKNPPGFDPGALVPGKTVLCHGSFRFRLLTWDGAHWRVECRGAASGWHGFDLDEHDRGCQLTHTLDVELSGAMRLIMPLVIEPIHDWAVESIFDRMEEALRTGRVPARTARPMPRRAALSFKLMRAVPRRFRREWGSLASPTTA